MTQARSPSQKEPSQVLGKMLFVIGSVSLFESESDTSLKLMTGLLFSSTLYRPASVRKGPFERVSRLCHLLLEVDPSIGTICAAGNVSSVGLHCRRHWLYDRAHERHEFFFGRYGEDVNLKQF